MTSKLPQTVLRHGRLPTTTIAIPTKNVMTAGSMVARTFLCITRAGDRYAPARQSAYILPRRPAPHIRRTTHFSPHLPRIPPTKNAGASPPRPSRLLKTNNRQLKADR
jgi:hypothetical protein